MQNLEVASFDLFTSSISELIEIVSREEKQERFWESNTPSVNYSGAIEVNGDGMGIDWATYDAIVEGYNNNDESALFEIYKKLVTAEAELYLDNYNI